MRSIRPARLCALAAVITLVMAAPAGAQLVGPVSTEPGSTLVSAGASVKVRGTTVLEPTTVHAGVPEEPEDDRGTVGTVTDLLCDAVSNIDGEKAEALAEALCLLRAAELHYVTVFGNAGEDGVRREQASAVGVPTALDVDHAPGPDLTATLRLTPDRKVVLDVVKAAGAPARLPVSVEVVAANPSPSAGEASRLTGGYDAREHGAPASFAATITPGDRLGVNVVTAGARESLALVGGTYDATEGGGAKDPVLARARFAGVPASIDVGLAFPSSPGSSAVDADLVVDRASHVTVDVNSTAGADSTFVNAVAQVQRRLATTVTTTDAPTAEDPEAKALDLVLEAAPSVSRAEATVLQLRSGVQRSKVHAVAEGLPLRTVARLEPRRGESPMLVDVATTGGPIGLVDVARSDRGEPERLADDRYVFAHETATAKAVAARVRGLSRATVKLFTRDVEVDAALAAGPFRVRVDDADTNLDTRIADLPATVAFAMRPATGVIDYRGAAPIGLVDVTLEDRSGKGIARSERTGVVAPHLRALIGGVPEHVNAVFAPTTGDVTVHAGDGTLGSVFAHVTSNPADGLQAGDPQTRDGVTVRDVDGLFATVVRLTGLRRTELSTAPATKILLRSASRRAVAFDVRRRRGTATERISGAVADRPSCMAFTLAAAQPAPRCSASLARSAEAPAEELEAAEGRSAAFATTEGFEAQDTCEVGCGPGDDDGGGGTGGGGGGTGGGGTGGGGTVTPKPPAYVLYEGPDGTGRIDVELSGLEGMPAGKAVVLGLAGIPNGMSARLHGGDISAVSTAGEIGRTELRFTDGPRDDAIAEDRDGVVVRTTLEREVVFARISALREAAVSIAGDAQSFKVDSAAVRPFSAFVEHFQERTDVLVSDLPAGALLTLADDAQGQSVIGFEGKEPTGSLQLTSTSPPSRVLRANVHPVPKVLRMCTHPGQGCEVNLLETEANRGSIKLAASEPIDVFYEDCKRPGEGGTCTVDDEGTQFTRLSNVRLQYIAFQQWVHKAEDKTRIGFDTGGLPLRANAAVVDYIDPDIEQMHAHLPDGFSASGRAVEIDSTGIPTQSWKTGSITCPEGTSVFVVPASGPLGSFGLTDYLCD